MFNLDGEVVGINTAIFSPSGGSIGIGFAIPSISAQPVIQQLIQHGQVRRGWLGVRIQAVTEEIADALGLKEAGGALVAGVIPGGPAEKASLKDGDIILEFDGKPIGQMRRLPRLVADTEVGKTVPIKVWREGRELSMKVEVGELKESEEKLAAATPGTDKPSGGESSQDLDSASPLSTIAARDRFGLEPDARGVVVTSVDPNGPAAEQGVRVGDRIVEVAQEAGIDAVAARGEDQGGPGGADGKRCCCWSRARAGMRFVAIKLAQGLTSSAAESTTPPLIQPFAAIRPIPQRAQDVAARPYDVLSFAEAKAGGGRQAVELPACLARRRSICRREPTPTPPRSMSQAAVGLRAG